MTKTESRAGTDVDLGYRINDADNHFTEPPDLWTANAPAERVIPAKPSPSVLPCR